MDKIYKKHRRQEKNSCFKPFWWTFIIVGILFITQFSMVSAYWYNPFTWFDENPASSKLNSLGLATDTYQYDSGNGTKENDYIFTVQEIDRNLLKYDKEADYEITLRFTRTEFGDYVNAQDESSLRSSLGSWDKKTAVTNEDITTLKNDLVNPPMEMIEGELLSGELGSIDLDKNSYVDKTIRVRFSTDDKVGSVVNIKFGSSSFNWILQYSYATGDPLQVVDMSYDNTWLATGSQETPSQVSIYWLQNSTPTLNLTEPQNHVNDLRFTADNTYLLAGDEDGAIWVYWVNNWSLARRVNLTTSTTSVDASQDNVYMAASSYTDNYVEVRWLTNLSIVKNDGNNISQSQPLEIRFSNNSQVLAVGGADGNITRYNTTDYFTPNGSIDAGGQINSLGWSKDNRYMFLGGESMGGRPGMNITWAQNMSGKGLGLYGNGNLSYGRGFDIVTDWGDYVAVGVDGTSNRVRVFYQDNWTLLYEWNLTGAARNAVFSRSDYYIGFVDLSGNLEVYNTTLPSVNVGALTTSLGQGNDGDTNSTTWINHTAIITSTGDYYINNATLYVWNSDNTIRNETLYDIGGAVQSFQPSWNNTGYETGTYTWNVKGVATGVDEIIEDWAGSNRTQNIDLGAPAIVVYSPIGMQPPYYHMKNMTSSYKITDLSLDTVWYDYNATNITLCERVVNPCVSAATEEVYFNVSNYTDTQITFWANDTFENVDYLNGNWNWSVVEHNIIYNNNTLENVDETIKHNTTYDPSYTSISASLIYNGTVYGTTKRGTGKFINFTRTITTPDVVGTNKIGFVYQFQVVNTTGTFLFNTTFHNQTVTGFTLDDCSVNAIQVLNYSLRDEGSRTILHNSEGYSFDVELDAAVSPPSNISASSNATFTKTNINPVQVCINVMPSNSTILRLDSLVRYDADGRVPEYHNIQNYTIIGNTTIPVHVDLYDLLETNSTSFKITYEDNYFSPVPDALIDISRLYVSLGSFLNVELPKTDSDGVAIGHFDVDEIYNIIVSKNGRVLDTFENIQVYCVSGQECVLDLSSAGSASDWTNWDTVGEVTYDMNFNQNTRTISAIFASTDGSSKTVTLNATKIDRFGNDTVCGQTITSSSGTLTCVIPQSYGNVTVIAGLYSKGNTMITSRMYSIIEDTFDTFGSDGLMMVLILIITIPLMLTSSTIGIVLGIGVGFIMAIYLGLMKGTLFGVGSSILWFVIAGGIIVWKLSQRD